MAMKNAENRQSIPRVFLRILFDPGPDAGCHHGILVADMPVDAGDLVRTNEGGIGKSVHIHQVEGLVVPADDAGHVFRRQFGGEGGVKDAALLFGDDEFGGQVAEEIAMMRPVAGRSAFGQQGSFGFYGPGADQVGELLGGGADAGSQQKHQ